MKFKIDFINRVGDVTKSGASNQIAIVDPGEGDMTARGASDRAIKSRSLIVN